MNNFTSGDIVYYIGDDRGSLKKNIPYKVFINKLGNLGISVGGWIIYSPMENFISDLEYKKNNQKGNNNFKINDYVYYINNTKFLKNGVKYKVINVRMCGMISGVKLYDLTLKSPSGQLHDGYNSNDFISEQEYNDVHNPSLEKNKFFPKDDSIIRMQIFQDTKNGILKWTKPYKIYDEWYRAILKLKNPSKAYLRFDVRKISEDWELVIYYHRNKIADSIIIKKIEQTNSLLTIVRKIQNSLEDE